MFRCTNCGREYDEPRERIVCLEAEYGVSSMFGSSTYETDLVCPHCGEYHYYSEEVDDE